jgi:hypothetical protein
MKLESVFHLYVIVISTIRNPLPPHPPTQSAYHAVQITKVWLDACGTDTFDVVHFHVIGLRGNRRLYVARQLMATFLKGYGHVAGDQADS